MIFLTENIPYTPKMLADELGFEENTVRLALEALEQLNMIHSDGFLSVSGWEEYQNIDGMEKIREQNRIRKQAERARKKMLPEPPSRDSHATVTQSHATEEDIEEDIERRNKKESNKTAKRFTPPTVDEVAEYCRERGNNIDAAHFVDYYSARGWELSKGRKLKDWKAAVRTWERNGYSKPRTGANGVRITDAKTDILDDIF